MRDRSPPRVFLVIGSLGFGGTERQIVEFVRAAHPHDAECTVVCLAEEGPMAEQVRAVGARVVVLDARRPHWHRGFARLVRLLRRERPDAVYALLFHAYVYTLPFARAVRPGAVRIAGRRSMSDIDIAGVPGARRMRLGIDRITDRVIANSDAVREDWERENPRLRGRIDVVPNGIRVPDVEPVPRPDGGRMRIVCVANLIAYKGHGVLIDALDALRDRDDWIADLVGEGPERASIESRLRDLGLDGRVTLHGTLPADRVHPIVKASDVAVLPSLTEGLPNVVMEAMAHGVPVVASDVGGVRDLLAGGAGAIVPPGDAEAMAQALRAYLDDPARRIAAGGEGQRRIAERYSVEAMRDATLAVIRTAQAQRELRR